MTSFPVIYSQLVCSQTWHIKYIRDFGQITKIINLGKHV